MKAADDVIRRHIGFVFLSVRLIQTVLIPALEAPKISVFKLSPTMIASSFSIFISLRQCSKIETSGFPFPKAPEMTISLK